MLPAVTNGAGYIVIGIRAKLSPDAEQGRKTRCAQDAAPMFIDPVLEPGITGGVARGLAIEDDRAAIGQDQPVPDQQHAALSEGDVCVIVADQARTLGDEDRKSTRLNSSH